MYRALSRRAAAQARRLLATKAAPPGDGPNHRSILALDGNTIRPFVQPNAYVAPSASIIGSVVVNDKTAVMYGAVVRGDLALIHIGAYSFIGDNSTLTAGVVDSDMSPADAVASGLSLKPELLVGDYTLVGANVALTSCHLEGENVIGDCAVIEAGARIGRCAVIAPNSVVAADTHVPEGELWSGSPAEKVRDVTADEKERNQHAAVARTAITAAHASEFLPVGTAYLEKEQIARESAAAVKA